MNDFLSKLSKAADAFAEVITEGVKPNQNVRMYTYEELKKTVLSKKKGYPEITKCTISVQLRKEFDNMVFSDNKYIIRIVMLDDECKPVCVENNEKEYVGSFIIADAIDKRLSEFMGKEIKKTVMIGGK